MPVKDDAVVSLSPDPLPLTPLPGTLLPLAASTRDLPTIDAAAQDHAWLCGSPDDVIASLQEFQERYPGVEHINVNAAIGTPGPVILEQLERFAREVMPVFLPPSVRTDGAATPS